MKNKLKNKVILASSSFFFALSCLGVSTYAWFTIANTLAVDNFNFEMKSEGDLSIGLRISNEVLAKKYNLNVGDIYFPSNGSINDDLLMEFEQFTTSTNLKSLTSSNDDLWLDEDKDLKTPILNKIPSINDIHGLRQANKQEMKDMTYQLELYLRSERPMEFYVDPQTYVKVDQDRNANEFKKYQNPYFSIMDLNNVTKSMRVSFYSSENYFIYEVDPSYDINNQRIKTNFFGRLDQDPKDGYYDFKDGKEILFGEYDETKLVYDEEGRALGSEFNHYSNGMEANTYEEVIPVDINKSIKNGIEGREEISYTLEEISQKSNDKTGKFKLATSGGLGNYNGMKNIQRVIVTVYLEGWDVDTKAFPCPSHFNMNLVIGGKSLTEYAYF